jgi:hypothetical protein
MASVMALFFLFPFCVYLCNLWQHYTERSEHLWQEFLPSEAKQFLYI